MIRLGGAVLGGYVLMAVIVFAGLSLAYLGMGPDRAFRSGVYDVSMLWVVTSLVVGFGAALAGGWVAGRVDGGARGPWVLAVVVVLLGLTLAIPALGGDAVAPGSRLDGPGVFDAMRQARTPVWLMLLNPFMGALGVLLGGGALRPAEPAPRPDLAA
jgi:hypothetical protein